MNRGLDSDVALVRAPDVIAVHVGSVLVLHDPRRDSYTRVNASGELLWERLTAPCTAGELAGVLEDRYGLPSPQAEADVQRIVAALIARGLLEPAEDLASPETQRRR